VLRSAVVVDVESVGLVVDQRHVGTQFAEDGGGDLVGRPVADVHRDLDALERQAPGEGVLEEHDVAGHGVVQPHRLAHVLRRGDHVREGAGEDQVLDLGLLLVRELEARAGEHLDPVVLERVVGGGHHEARVRPHALRDVGDPRRREHADHLGVTPHRGDPGLQGALQHVAGDPGVLADHDAGAVSPLPQDVGHRLADGEGHRRVHGVAVGLAPDPIGSEQFAHRASPSEVVSRRTG